ncbi:hypothetical protein BDW74DRAFT_174741 [Aspergillus multicolor]|uniref:uncharacterized protein n=1 Tax=Aspergillus multicolor TaxID=41759 RepID=UPI003CCE030B
MQSSTSKLFAFSVLLATIGQCAPQPAPTGGNVITPLFNAEFQLEPPLGPIAVPRGGRIVEQIPTGTITGAINGTITSGFVAPIIYSQFNETEADVISTSDAYLYGITDDDGPLYVQATGIGKNGRSVAKLSIEIGGVYKYLQSEFVLGRIVTDVEAGVGRLEGFVVALPRNYGASVLGCQCDVMPFC